jgi:hypothetical protein
MLVCETALKHKKPLATIVSVLKTVSRCVADDRGSSCYFIADAIQHTPLDPGYWRWQPRDTGAMNRGTLCKVGVELLRLPYRRNWSTDPPVRSGGSGDVPTGLRLEWVTAGLRISSAKLSWRICTHLRRYRPVLATSEHIMDHVEHTHADLGRLRIKPRSGRQRHRDVGSALAPP